MRTAVLTATLLLLSLASATAQTHEFEEVAPGVYFATDAGGDVYLMSNALVVETDDHVVVVDSHVTPAAGRALLASIAELTDKPVRTLINSHWHFDHAHGNQVFPPEVTVIGHEYTYGKLSGAPLQERTFKSFTDGFTQQLASLAERLESAAEDERGAIEHQMTRVAGLLESTKEIEPRAPDVTLSRKMTLHEGGRTLELHFLGRGHTGGDVVVLLPEERIAFTGDLLLPFVSYMGDGFVAEWPSTLEKLKTLEFDLLLPGHGGPIRDRAHIDALQRYYTDLQKRVAKMHADGVPFTEAALRVDMTDHADDLPIRGAGVDVRAVERIYALLDDPSLD